MSFPTVVTWPARVAGVVLLLLGFLPIVNWIPGGRSAPWYAAVASTWVSGTAIVLGGGIVLAILGRRMPSGAAWYTRVASRGAAYPGRTGAILAIAGFAAYAAIASLVFSGMPLHLDEVAQVIQARIFAQGRLYLEAPTYPEFRSALHVIDTGGRWYTQFPPGGPLLLVPGVWLGAPWLVNPLLGGGCLALFWGIMRRVESRPTVALGAAVLLGVTPFMAFMSASHMNHVGTLFFALLAWWAATRLAVEGWTPAMAVVVGLALGVMATIRPVDALAVALPIGSWMAWRILRGRDALVPGVLAAVGVAVPLLGLLWYNARTTGSPLLFAYELLWGPEHGLGFHASPWGAPHTPSAGLELISLYFLRLQTYLFESSSPSLILPVIWLLFGSTVAIIDRKWLVTGALVVVLYWAYWHDGFYLGPRFLFLAVPMLVAWAARVPGVVRDRWPRVAPPANGAMVVAAAMSIQGVWSSRLPSYTSGLSAMRWDVPSLARDAGVSKAVVLVRETWGAQLMARLWNVTESMPFSEAAYRSTDACLLDKALGLLERSGTRGSEARAALARVMGDSGRLVPSPWSPDASERALPGEAYAAQCVKRIEEDRDGTVIFTGLLAQDWESNEYVRDLHSANLRLEVLRGDRPLYLLKGSDSEVGARPVFVRLSRDSVLRVWRDAAEK